MAKRDKDEQTEQYWRLVLEEFQSSGLNVREFCRTEGVREPSFYAWRREIGKRDGERPNKPKTKDPHREKKTTQPEGRRRNAEAPTPALVEIVTRFTASTPAIEIETPTGFTIRLGGEVDRELVASVLASVIPLEKGPC